MSHWLTVLAGAGWLAAALAIAVLAIWWRRLRPDRVRSFCLAPEQSRDGLVLVDGQDRLMDANRAALAILGTDCGAIVGRPIGAFLPGLDGKALPELGGGPAEVVLADGRIVQVSMPAVTHALGWRTGRLIGLQEITARKQIEAETQRFQFMVENAGTECYLARSDGSFAYVNPAAAASLGYTVEELQALGAAGIDPAIGSAFADCAEKLRQDDMPPFETTHVAKDGRRIPKEVRATRLRIGGEDYVCAFAQSIVDRKRAEAQRRELERRTRQNERLESLASLAGEVAHDFNNMLTAILGNLELALDEMPGDAPGRPGVADAMPAGHRAAGLARQMLAFAGRGRANPVPLQLATLLEGVQPRLRALVPEHIQLQVRTAGTVPDVLADAAQIQQGLANLVANACDAIGSKAGVVTVSLSLQRYDESALAACHVHLPSGPGSYAVLAVTDDGCGMDAATVDRVLDPFFTTKVGARGLGLTMVHGIAKLLHGAVLVDSTPGEGTTVRLILPVHRGFAAAVPRAATSPPRPRAPAATPVGQLLIVDDEISVRILASRMATRLGFGVLQAADGVEGVEQFRQHVAEVTCVLLDLTMPRMDGIATFTALREIRPDVPIVLCSGYSERDATLRLIDQRLSGFLAKPFTYEAFQAVIGQVMEAAPAASPGS